MRDKEIFYVEVFKEKFDKEIVEKYLVVGNYFWNVGIFVWNVRMIIVVMWVYVLGIVQIFDWIYFDFYIECEEESVKKLFFIVESILIDYVVMEKVEEIYVLFV